ncbi:MAG: beta-lactamase family protein [Acidobacteriia bacterium]|nr:beta-lactamase family protein [Terriglobia bacterium]
MRRRTFLTTALACSIAHAARRDDLEAAADLVGAQVAGGAVQGAVLDVRRDKDVFQRCYGSASTVDAIFLLASITKPMTAAGAMLLADRGESKLADPVRRFIPEFSAGARSRVTVKQLLTHTSGLPDQLPENVELRKRNAPLSEFVERTIRTPLLFEPGTRYSYQSMGILLLAEICERITGTAFPEYLEQSLFRPLAMERTALGLGRIRLDQTQRSQVEQGPPHGGQGRPEASHWDWNSRYWRELASPWGGAHASAADVSRFFLEFLAPERAQVLRPATAALMVRNHTSKLGRPRGLGFALGSGAGAGCSERTAWHGGATGTLAWADPQSGVRFVLLTTLPNTVANKLLIGPVSDLVSQASQT